MILDTKALLVRADGAAAVREPWLQPKRLIISANDAWIAALARQHDMPVLGNDRHFDEVEELERIGF